MHSFLLAAKSFFELFSYSLESPISDRSSFAQDILWANLKNLDSVLRTLRCFLRDETPEPFYSVISFIA